jgi:hypothetical protein
VDEGKQIFIWNYKLLQSFWKAICAMKIKNAPDIRPTLRKVYYRNRMTSLKNICPVFLWQGKNPGKKTITVTCYMATTPFLSIESTVNLQSKMCLTAF